MCQKVGFCTHDNGGGMELMSGYKLSDVGVIPDDWGVSTLGQICSFENGDRSNNYPSLGSFRHS